MVMVYWRFAFTQLSAAACTPKVYTPAFAVGVPVMVPSSFRVRPDGSSPLLMV